MERPVSACVWICAESTGPTDEANARRPSSVVLHARFPMNTTFVVPAQGKGRGGVWERCE